MLRAEQQLQQQWPQHTRTSLMARQQQQRRPQICQCCPAVQGLLGTWQTCSRSCTSSYSACGQCWGTGWLAYGLPLSVPWLHFRRCLQQHGQSCWASSALVLLGHSHPRVLRVRLPAVEIVWQVQDVGIYLSVKQCVACIVSTVARIVACHVALQPVACSAFGRAHETYFV